MVAMFLQNDFYIKSYEQSGICSRKAQQEEAMEAIMRRTETRRPTPVLTPRVAPAVEGAKALSAAS